MTISLEVDDLEDFLAGDGMGSDKERRRVGGKGGNAEEEEEEEEGKRGYHIHSFDLGIFRRRLRRRVK